MIKLGLKKAARGGKAGRGSLGLAVSGAKLALAHVLPDASGARLRAFASVDNDVTSLRRQLREWSLDGAACTVSLSADEYKMTLADAPGVPDPELRSAMRWRAKELFDRMMEEAVIDVFRVPEGGWAGRQASVFVVASTTKVVNDHRDRVQASGAQLHAIDIADLALGNLLTGGPLDQEGAALLYLESNFSVVSIYRDSALYLSRRIPLGSNDIRSAAASNGLTEVWGRLAPEVQRTLDYYERHYAARPVGKVLVAPAGAEAEAACNALGASLGLPVELLRLGDFLPGATETPPPGGLLAAGAALRGLQPPGA